MPDINWLAVVLAAVAAFVLGGIWYSPLLFAKPRQRLAGLSNEDLASGNPAITYKIPFLLALVAAAVLSLATPSGAQTPPPFPAVTDASFVRPDGERIISMSTVIPVAPEAVWAALTTAEGWKAHMGVAQARVDLRIGGEIETSYSPETPLGSGATIINQVVAYVPERMLTIRNTQAPPGFAHAAEFARTVTVIELTPQNNGTRVDLYGVGFVPGPAFDDLYQRFLIGDAYTLQILHDSLSAAAGQGMPTGG